LSALVVFSCDQKYFPLAKGLVLSLRAAGLAQSGIGIGFIDIGCNPQSLKWFSDQGIRVLPLSALTAIEDIRAIKGYHLAQVCRAYLPRLFPDVRCFVWLDSDLWVQIGDTVKLLAQWASSDRERLFICPEWHYAYETFNNDVMTFHVRNVGSYYAAAYGEDVAAKMAVRPFLNTGVFAMAAENPLWGLWAADMKTLYARDYVEGGDLARHMADGLSLTRLAAETSRGAMVDPLFNFACIWALPFRDNAGVVRVALPPYAPIGIVHLNMWTARRRFYFEQRLLFQEGRYLTDDERGQLLSQ
jgi:hypothetical protein